MIDAFYRKRPKAFEAFYSRDFVYVGTDQTARARADIMGQNERAMSNLASGAGPIKVTRLRVDGFSATVTYDWEYHLKQAGGGVVTGSEIGQDSWRYWPGGWLMYKEVDSRPAGAGAQAGAAVRAKIRTVRIQP